MLYPCCSPSSLPSTVLACACVCVVFVFIRSNSGALHKNNCWELTGQTFPNALFFSVNDPESAYECTSVQTDLPSHTGYGSPAAQYTDDRAGTGQMHPYTWFKAASARAFSPPLEDLPDYQKKFCVESQPYTKYKEGTTLIDTMNRGDFDRTDPSRCLTKREILLPSASGACSIS